MVSSVALLTAFLMPQCSRVNKILPCSVVVTLNPLACDVCVFHAMVFSEIKLVVMLWFVCLTFLGSKYRLC